MAPHITKAVPLTQKGFTLLEAVVSLSILLGLMGVLYPFYKYAQEAHKRIQLKTDLAFLKSCLEIHRLNKGDYPHIAPDAHRPDKLLYQALFVEGVKGTLGKGPLTVLEDGILDPWGQPYAYAYQPERNSPLSSGVLDYTLTFAAYKAN